jgi:hypothetical protein
VITDDNNLKLDDQNDQQETMFAYITDAVGQVNSKKLVKQLMNQAAQHALYINQVVCKDDIEQFTINSAKPGQYRNCKSHCILINAEAAY